MTAIEKNYYILIKQGFWKLTQISNVKMQTNVRKALQDDGIYTTDME